VDDKRKNSLLEIVVFTKARGPLTKQISLVDGKVVSDGSACAMGRGSARRVRLADLADLKALFEGLDSNQAIALGALRRDLDEEVAISTKAALARAPESTAVARSAENIKYREGEPAPILFDFDTKGMPDHVAKRIEEAGGFWGALVSICPGLAGAAYLIRRSTSSGLSNADTGETYPGSSGVHVYVEAEDGSDAERFLYALHDHAWRCGFGWGIPSRDGKFLERSIIDKMVGHGERLVFEGPPNVAPPLQQDAASRRPEVHAGARIDTRAIRPPLSPAESQAKAALVAEEERRIEPELKKARDTYVTKEIDSLRTRGLSLPDATKVIEKRMGGVLLPDTVLPFDDEENLGGRTVGDVLDAAEMFENAHLADPIEGVPYGRGKAIVYIGRRDGLPFIVSYAHGGAIYRLRYDARAIRKRLESAAPDKVGLFVKLLLAGDVDAVEEEQLVKEVAKAAKVGIKAVRAKIKEVREERNQRSGADGFELDRNGRPIANQRNIRRALELLSVGVRYDEFNDQVLVDGFADRTVVADDAIVAELWLLIEERYRFLPTKDFFHTVVDEAARRNALHPVRDYLDGLNWDGVPRLDSWLVTYGGAEDTEYVRAVGALTLVAAVRRVRKPGVKFDEMLIFEMPTQGRDKSTAIQVLAVREAWFSDDLPLNSDGKRVIEQTRGKWIVEASELSGMRKSDVEHLKAMLSRTSDRARLSYDRRTTDRPRQFIVIGTTNATYYLRDTTGNRRFWPVAVTGFNLVTLANDRDQLWAEAAAREATGASIRLDPELWAAAGEEQEERQIADPWLELLRATTEGFNGKILAADAWKLVGMAPDRRTQDHNGRLGGAMRTLGFEHKPLRFDGKLKKCYARGTAEEQEKRIYVYEGGFGCDPHCSLNSPNDPQTKTAAAEQEKLARETIEKWRNGRPTEA
jgi:predicted P-loop ATPase